MTESSQRRNLLIYLSLAAAIALLYSPVRNFGFVDYDDPAYIVENTHLRAGLTLKGLGWALTTPLDQWMPVTWLARMLEYQLFGLDAGAHHLVNVLFHIVNTLLLFSVLNRMTSAPSRSAMVAALFALHPLHVESVAWVTGLKDVLSMCLAMLTIWAYARYVEQINVQHPTSDVQLSPPHAPPSAVASAKAKLFPFSAFRSPPSAFYALTLLFFTLALMSKPMVVTLPFMLLLLDYWPLGRTQWAEPAAGERVKVPLGELFKEKLPFLVLTGVSCVVTVWAQRTAGALDRVPLGRIANALLTYVGYLGKVFWPTGLAVFYPLDRNISWAAAMVACVGLVGVTVAVIWRARREPWLATGWFWYLGTLVPVIGLVQVGIVQGMADRYTYVPSVGLFVMLCWSVPHAAMERRILKVTVYLAAVAVLAVCAMLTRIQVGYWKNTETLFRHALNVTRDNWMAHNNLGAALLRLGRVQEAMGHWEQALRIKPDSPLTHYNLGNYLLQTGKVEDAIGHYKQALQVKPDYGEAHYSLGVALWQEGRLQDAVGHYEQALRLNPDVAEVHYSLGLALARLRRMQEAVGHWEQALRIKPDYAEAHYDLGLALVQLGRVSEAIEHWEQALRIKPDYAEAHTNLGVALERAGRVQEAIGHYEKALQIKPQYADAHYNLGIALERLGRVEEAIAQYEQALRIKPDYAEAHNNLGSALARVGRVSEAIGHWEQALRINPDYARAHYNLGVALEGAGRLREAMGHYEQAVRINPQMVEAQNRLARLRTDR